MTSDILACPHDLSPLETSGTDFWKCIKCAASWPIKEGVACFLTRDDSFYEGAYRTHVRFAPRTDDLLHAWPLWLVNGGYPWTVRQNVRPGATILELGCAGGVRYFGQRYRMVGCDLSRASLQSVTGIYSLLLQANAAERLPLADDSVDAVISSFFWEHIDPGTKPVILSECRRVLRPGGKLVFLYDIETNNPAIRGLKKSNMATYRSLFLDGDGHVGYESREANLSTFEAAGFRVIHDAGLEATPLQSPSVYEKLKRSGVSPNFMHRMSASLGTGPWQYPYLALLRALDVTIGRIAPPDWARIALTVSVVDKTFK